MRVLCTGPESAGTRMLTRLVDSLGVEAIHRSIPHGMEWWNPPTNIDRIVVIVRSALPNTLSAYEAGHYRHWGHGPESVPARISEAWRIIGTEIPKMGLPWMPTTHESWIINSQAEYNCLAGFLDAEIRDLPFEIYNPREGQI